MTTDAFAADWRDWHRQHEARRAGPHGVLAVTGQHWLDATPQHFPDAPGDWSTGPDGVTVVLGRSEDLVVDGAPVWGRHAFGVIPERGEVTAVWGDAVIEVTRRGGRDLLRPRHPGNPLRTDYGGTPAYPPSRLWSFPATYAPFDRARPTIVGAAVDGLEHVYDAAGWVYFQIDGRPFRLLAFPGRHPGRLTILFTDATSGITTYAANRTLEIDPEPSGAVQLDFNRATNLPCAYTDLATCPLPPAENRLPVAIEAGEKIPYERLYAAA
jgi:uncharacterized protein (DUF1684 family)